MGSYCANVILPIDTDISNDQAVEQAVKKLIEPYAPINEEHPVQDVWFDSYWCITKEWLPKWEAEFPKAIRRSKLLIVPNDSVTSEDVVRVVVSPDGAWHESQTTWRSSDLEWESKFMTINNQYLGHYSSIVYFKC